MGRKVFLSVLGTGYYDETKYCFEEIFGNEPSTRFLQYAAIKHFCKNWSNQDTAIIFLTQAARKTNWQNPAQINNRDNKKPYEGLSSLLEKLNYGLEVKTVDIPDGNNENEIWKIFQSVFDQFEDGDDVYFDITHAFRFLPMLLMVLINYSKFLKNIRIRSITYGNHQMENNGYSPVVDLISISQLQDWTSAANEFISFGSVNKISELSLETLRPLLKETMGRDKTVSSLKRLSVLLPMFVKNMQTCRGTKIFENYEGSQISTILDTTSKVIVQPLDPILERLKDEMTAFSEPNNLMNGFKAVEWCIRNNLTQQAITLLQEMIISFACDEMKLDLRKIEHRNLISSCFNIYARKIEETDWKNEAAVDKELTKKILNSSTSIKKLNKEFCSLTDLRNDINHAGFTENSKENPDKFEKNIKEIYYSIAKMNIKCS
jgi:CRISPR-associated Csx2 family protein